METKSDSVEPYVAHQAPLSMGFSKQEYWSGLPCPLPGESSQSRDQTCISYISCISRWVLHQLCPWEAQCPYLFNGDGLNCSPLPLLLPESKGSFTWPLQMPPRGRKSIFWQEFVAGSFTSYWDVCVYVVGDAGLLTLGFSPVLSCPMVQELETFSLSAPHKPCLQQ